MWKVYLSLDWHLKSLVISNDRQSSLVALAFEGGLGLALGELALAVVGVLDVLVLALVPKNMSMPGMPDNMAGFMP